MTGIHLFIKQLCLIKENKIRQKIALQKQVFFFFPNEKKTHSKESNKKKSPLHK